MKNLNRTIFLACLALFSFTGILVNAQAKYQAPRALVTPTINGFGDDDCWATAPWYDINYLWLGAQPTTADFSGRFKISWDSGKLYVYAEITDDVLNDNYANPLSNYWEDDTWEVFLDENNSGGLHETNYNAMAYHVSRFLDNVDVDIDGNPKLYNSVANIVRTNTGNLYRWEGAFDVYTDAYVYANGTANPKAALVAGKIMGFAMAYCDNDGGATRQSFIGSEDIPGTNKNVAYQNANVFGKVQLVDAISPQFSQVLVTNGITNPTVMAMAPDGRIFVAQQQGALRVVKNGALLPTPAITLTVEASGSYTERGLIGITLDPNFALNNYIYLFYTTTQGGTHNRVSRFTLNGDVVVPGSEVIILDLDPLTAAINHNGGALHFGLDGTLFIATGDNATPANAQNLTNTHGKMLRINVDGSIPANNPYASATNAKQRMIWNHGMRNPFTFDIQPGTGRIYVNDVGQDAWEEINDITTAGGRNFGWPAIEGIGTNPAYVNPVYAYGHNFTGVDTLGCAITGGCFFNPPGSTNYPSKYFGKYFFMDYCNDWINVFDPITGKRMEVFARNISGLDPIAIDVHVDGNLYYLSRNGGLYKITYSGNIVPDILTQPISQSVAASQPVTFSVQATGAIPLTYQWRKNGGNINGATSTSFTIASVSGIDAGNYSVFITNSFGSVTSNIAGLTVTAFNSRPIATITSPAFGSKYNGGQTFTFTGLAADLQDGSLPPNAFTWRVDLHHAQHVHDGIPLGSVTSFQYTIPVVGHADTNTYYRITLYVRDSGGLTDTTFVNVYPNKAILNLVTQPAGLQVTVDGQPFTTPYILPSVAGTERTIGVVNPQSIGGKAYGFGYWSQGGTQTQSFPAPSNLATYTAFFIEIPVTRDSTTTIKDSYVQFTSYAPGDANLNFGYNSNLVVKNYSATPNRETFISFNLNRLKGARTNLSSVKLKLYGAMLNEGGPANISISAFESVSNNWNEWDINFTNKPGNNPTALATLTVSSTISGFYNWDITNFVKSKTAPADSIITIVLKSNSDHINRVIFNSKENFTITNWANFWPKLVVDFAIPCTITSSITPNGPLSICTGNSVLLNANTGSGLFYNWTRNAITVSTTSSSFIATSSGVYLVEVSNAAGCKSISSPITVTVNPSIFSTVSISSSLASVCSGTGVTFTATGLNGGSNPTYTWFRNNISQTTGTTYNYIPSNGDVVRAVLNSGGTLPTCLANTSATSTGITLAVTGNVFPSISILSSATSVCSGTGVTFTATGLNGGSTPTFTWFRNNISQSSGTTLNYIPANGDVVRAVLNAGGTLPTCLGNSSATSTGITLTVTGNVFPSIIISSSATSVCSGTGVTFTATGLNGGSTPTFTWFRNNISQSSGTTLNYIPANGDVVRVVLNTGGTLPTCLGNTSATSTGINLAVTGNVFPSISILSSATSVCSGTGVTFTATGLNGGSTPTFTWFRNNISQSSGTTLNYIPTNGDMVRAVLNTGGTLPTCLGNTSATSTGITLTVTGIVFPSISISSSATSVCSGTGVTFTATGLNSGSAPTFTWFRNNISQTSANTYSFIPTNGDVVRAVLNSGGTLPTCLANTSATSTGITLLVTGNVFPSVSISGSATSVCSGTGVTFTATGLNGGSTPTFTWFRNNISQSSGTTFNYIPSNGDVVRAVLNAGGTLPTCLSNNTATSTGIALTVNPSLVSSVSVSPSANPICAGTGVTFTATPTNGGNSPIFRWLVNNVVQVGNTNQFTYSPSNNDIVRAIQTIGGTGILCVSNTISTSTGITISVTGTISTAIAISSATTTVCSGISVLVNSTASGTGSAPVYTWFKNGIAQSGNTNSFNFIPANNDQIRLSMTPGGTGTTCIVGGTVTSAGVIFNVNNIPTAPLVSGAINYCQLSVANPISAVGTNLLWYTASVGGVGTSVAPVPSTSLAGAQNYFATSNTNGCESSRSKLDVNIIPNTTPSVSISASTSNVCSGTGITFTATGINRGTAPSYSWFINGTSQTNNGPTFTIIPSNNDIVRAVLTPGGTLPTCLLTNPVTSNGVNITVNAPGSGPCPLPTPSSISGPVFVGVGTNGVVYSVVSVPGNGYNWTVPNGATIVSGQGTNQISVNFGPNPISGAIGLTQSNSNGSNSVSLNVASGTPPSTTTIVGPLVVNPSQTGVVYSVASVPGTNYNWTVPSGATIVSGQGTNQITVNFTASVNGFVTLNSTNNFGNTSSSISVSTSPITYLIGNSADMIIQVLPNPFNESSFVKSTVEFKYSIYDLAGHEKETGIGNGGQSIGNTLSPGAYVLKCEIGNTTQLIKLIKY